MTLAKAQDADFSGVFCPTNANMRINSQKQNINVIVVAMQIFKNIPRHLVQNLNTLRKWYTADPNL